MGSQTAKPELPTRTAIQRGQAILARMEAEGADFVGVDNCHAYIWHHEQLVNLYKHRELIQFLTEHGYLKPRTENKMMLAAWIIFEALKRCE